MFDSFSVFADAFAREHLSTPLIAFPAYIIAGFAGSLFPCVYPLIPVTIGYLQKRSAGERNRWKHPLFYWIGTVLSYTILGAAAAAGGGAFNTVMQNGFFIIFTGLLFLFLGFVLIDWHPLYFSGGGRIVDAAAHHRGVFFSGMMGFGAGFVSSACVAPALVTMLVFVAKQSAASGNILYGVAYGSFLSSGFGMGIGIPFFLSGVLGARLPRSGAWMSLIKYAFAILIALAGLYQIYKGFTVFGIEDMDIYLILFGLSMIVLSALLGLKPPDREDRPALTRFIFALILLSFAFAAIIRGANPVGQMKAAPAPVFETNGDLRFHRDGKAAFAEAREKGLPVFIDFYADWCANCKDFYNFANEHRELNNALRTKAILLKIHDTDAAFHEYAGKEEFMELNIGLPFFAIASPDETLIWKTTNYRDADGMVREIERAGSSAKH